MMELAVVLICCWAGGVSDKTLGCMRFSIKADVSSGRLFFRGWRGGFRTLGAWGWRYSATEVWFLGRGGRVKGLTGTTGSVRKDWMCSMIVSYCDRISL